MEELTQNIFDYIKSDYIDYAIMINGEWGSGKTYYWNNIIKNKIENLEFNGKKYIPIYVSLYGISNLEDISKKIYIETINFNKNIKKYMDMNKKNYIPEYTKTGLNMAHCFGMTQNGEEFDYESFFSTEDKVLCFDDLERAKVDVIDILGYINNFVEHDHIKTIIICNEKELLKKIKNTNIELKTFIATYLLDKEGGLVKVDKPISKKIDEKIDSIFDKEVEYERIKEKLVGETFEYVPQFEYIINGILLKYKSKEDFSNFLKENIDFISNTFKKSETKNLRILKHALEDFKVIFENVKKYNKDLKEEILISMLVFTIAISFEMKKGNLLNNKFAYINNFEEYKSNIVLSRVLMINENEYIPYFDTHYFFNIKTEYHFFKFIDIYIRTRKFDIKCFREEMKAIFNNEIKEVIPYKRILTEEYWKIPEADFEKIIFETLNQIRSGEVELIDSVKLYAYFIYFSKIGLIEIKKDEIKKCFMEGMEKSIKISRYCSNVKQELSQIENSKDNSVKEIKKYFISLNEKLREKEYCNIVDEVFSNLNENIENTYNKMLNEYSEIPIFCFYNPEKLFKKINDTKVENIVIIKEMLLNRVKKCNKILEEEITFMKNLVETINEYCNGQSNTIKNIVLKEFANELERYLSIYSISIIEILPVQDEEI